MNFRLKKKVRLTPNQFLNVFVPDSSNGTNLTLKYTKKLSKHVDEYCSVDAWLRENENDMIAIPDAGMLHCVLTVTDPKKQYMVFKLENGGDTLTIEVREFKSKHYLLLPMPIKRYANIAAICDQVVPKIVEASPHKESASGALEDPPVEGECKSVMKELLDEVVNEAIAKEEEEDTDIGDEPEKYTLVVTPEMKASLIKPSLDADCSSVCESNQQE